MINRVFSGAVGMIAHVEISLKILDDKTEKMSLDSTTMVVHLDNLF